MIIRMAQFCFPTAIIYLSLAGCMKPGTSGSGGTSGGSNKLLVHSFETTIYDTSQANSMQQFTITYTYDNNNRQLSGIEEGTSTFNGVASNISDTFNFSYGQNTKTETGVVHQGTISSSTTIVNYLNSSGYADSAVSSGNSGNITIGLTMIYLYDANMYCTEIDYSENINNSGYQPTGKTLYTISGGNVVEASSYSPGGSLQSTLTLNYGSSSNNTEVSPSIPPLSGHLNTDLVQSTSTVTFGNPGSALNYAYTYDSQNRVASITVTTPSGKDFLIENNIQYVN